MNTIIKKFFYIFVVDTTTNFDLLKYAKILKLKNFHVVMTDEIHDLPEDNFSTILQLSVNITRGYPLGSNV